MEYPFILFSSYLVGFIFLLFTIGHIAFSILNLQIAGKHSNVFAKLVSGIFIAIFFYSIYKTKFHTINTGFIIAAILLWSNRGFRIPRAKKAYQLLTNIEIKQDLLIIVQLCLVAVLILLWNHHYMFPESNLIPENPHSDLSFFARVSSFLNITGKETFEMNYLESQTLGATPYHYFEIWGNAFISFLFSVPSTLATIQLICIPTFLTIVISGIWAIMELFKINIFIKILSITLLFITGFFFPIYENIPLFWTSYFQVNLFDQGSALKTSVLYIGILAFSLLLLKNKHKDALTCLLFFPFASIFAFFTFIPSSIILPLYFYYRKKINFAFAIKIGLTAIISAIYFQLFYKFHSDKEFYSNAIDIPTIIQQLTELSLKSRVIIASEKFIELLILYIPFIILFPLLKNSLKTIKKETKEASLDIILGFCCFVLTSLISWNFFYFVFGTSEFFQAMTNSIMNISIYMLIYFILIYNINFLVRIGIIIYLFIFIAFQFEKITKTNNSFSKMFREKHSAEYVNSIALINISNQGANIVDAETINHANPFYYQNAPYFHYIKPECQITNISIYEIPGVKNRIDTLAKTTFINGSPFYRFVQSQKRNKTFISLKKSQLQFIDHYKIGFLIVSKNSKPDSLLRMRLKKEIKDEKSGEKFWILK